MTDHTEHRAHRDTDKILIRGKDIALITSVLILAGILVAIGKHPFQWDAAAQTLGEIKPVVDQTKNRVDILEAHYGDILRRLDSIDRKLDK